MPARAISIEFSGGIFNRVDLGRHPGLWTDTMTLKKLDCRGLSCPEPLILLKKLVREGASGDIFEVLSDDPVSLRDFPAYCRFMKHTLLAMPDDEHPHLFRIQKR